MSHFVGHFLKKLKKIHRKAEKSYIMVKKFSRTGQPGSHLKNFFLKDSSGFSLIGVLVASSIGVIVVLGLTQMQANIMDTMRTLFEKHDMIEISEEIIAELEQPPPQTCFHDNGTGGGIANNGIKDGGEADSSPLTQCIANTDCSALGSGHVCNTKNACSESFAGFEITDLDIPDVQNVPNTILPLDTYSKEEKGRVGSYTLSDPRLLNKGFRIYKIEIRAADTNNKARVFVYFSFNLEEEGVFQFATPLIIDLNVTLDATNKISTCVATGGKLASGGGGAANNDCYGVKLGEKKTLIGCGTTTQITNDTITAYGFNAGSSSAGNNNTFVGYEAGKNTTGQNNTFIGFNAGNENVTGNNNTFIGTRAGRQNTTGERNLYIGQNSGETNTNGDENTTLGNSAGRRASGSGNMFLGQSTGFRINGNNNVFLGTRAGWRMNSGSGNIYIGERAGDNLTSENNKFVVGNSSFPEWLSGTIGSKDITINVGSNPKVCLDDGTNCPSPSPSSRTLKKNIKPFKDFKKALEDILKTSLFTYEYKKDQPEKSRMGIISEELPEHLQIIEKGKASRPDWVSIYGTFWASLKELWEVISNQDKELKEVKKELKEAQERIKQNEKDLKGLRKEIKGLKKELKNQRGNPDKQ